MGLSPFKSAPNSARVIQGSDDERVNDSSNRARNVC